MQMWPGRKVTRTSALPATYDAHSYHLFKDEKPHIQALIQQGIHHNKEHFTDSSTTEHDHGVLEKIRSGAHNIHKEKFMGSEKKYKRAHALYSVNNFFHNFSENHGNDEKHTLFLELKNDFMEYVFGPCLWCRQADDMEEHHGPAMNATFLCIFFFTSLFYLLCLVWLFQARTVLQNAPSILASHINQYCDLPTIGSLNKVENYFIFRLTIYLISPLVLLVIAFASHKHQRVMLKRLTGFPVDDHSDDDRSFWIRFWPFLAVISVGVINILFGVLTIVFDCLFLTQMDAFQASADVNKRDCSNIFRGNLFNNTSQKFENLMVPVASVPIPLVLFNFVYTGWGFLFCIAVWVRPSVFTDSGTAMMAALHFDQDSPYASNYVAPRLKNALERHMHIPHLRPDAPAPPAAPPRDPHPAAPPAVPPAAPSLDPHAPLARWGPPPAPYGVATSPFTGFYPPPLAPYVADWSHVQSAPSPYYAAAVAGTARYALVPNPHTGQSNRVLAH